MPTVTGTFQDRATTERAVDDLVAAGFSRDDISVVMSDETRSRHFHDHDDVHGAHVAQGAAGGGAIGGTIGAIAGGILLSTAAVVATGGLAAPFIVAGPIAGALAGGGAGAAVGSIIGALVGAGIPEHEAHAVERDVRDGGIVLAVRTDDADATRASEILRREGPDVSPGPVSTVRGETDPAVDTLDNDPERVRRSPVI